MCEADVGRADFFPGSRSARNPRSEAPAVSFFRTICHKLASHEGYLYRLLRSVPYLATSSRQGKSARGRMTASERCNPYNL